MAMTQEQIEKEAHRIAADWMDQCNVYEWAEPDDMDDMPAIQSAFDALMDAHQKASGKPTPEEYRESDEYKQNVAEAARKLVEHLPRGKE